MKKLISLALVAAMTVTTLAGCGKAGNAGNAKKGDGQDTWFIGGIGPVTGTAAVYGTAVKNGAELAINEINADGGINGVQIQYDFQDDECDNEKSINAYNVLKDEGMNLLVGSTTSGCCIAVADKSAQDNMFQLTPSGSSTDCILNDNVFQVCFTDPNQGVAAAQYIGEHDLAKKVAVIYDSSDVYSSGIFEKFKEESANQSFDIVAEGAFTADSKTNFQVQLQQAQDAGAEMIFLPIYYTEASLIITQASSMGYDAKFFGCDGLDGILNIDNFDTSLAEGVILLTPFVADAKDEKTVNFVKAYEEAYGETPNQFAADSYDAVYILKAAIEKSEATPADGVDGVCDKLKAVMPEISVDGLTGSGMTWAATGEVSKSAKAMVIKNGAYTNMFEE